MNISSDLNKRLGKLPPYHKRPAQRKIGKVEGGADLVGNGVEAIVVAVPATAAIKTTTAVRVASLKLWRVGNQSWMATEPCRRQLDSHCQSKLQ